MQELIDRGASVDEATKDGATPLFIASEFGCLYVCVPYSYVSVCIYLCSTNQRLVLTPCVLNPPTHPPISAMVGVKIDHPVHHSSTFIKAVIPRFLSTFLILTSFFLIHGLKDGC